MTMLAYRKLIHKTGVVMAAKNLFVINVLSQASFEDCRIKGSINIPLDRLEAYAKDIDKDSTIVVHCSSYTCKASDEAYNKLSQLGFKQVHIFAGGMNEWHHAGFPTEGPCTAPYLAKRVDRPKDLKLAGPEISCEDLKKMMQQAGLFDDLPEIREITPVEEEMKKKDDNPLEIKED